MKLIVPATQSARLMCPGGQAGAFSGETRATRACVPSQPSNRCRELTGPQTNVWWTKASAARDCLCGEEQALTLLAGSIERATAAWYYITFALIQLSWASWTAHCGSWCPTWGTGSHPSTYGAYWANLFDPCIPGRLAFVGVTLNVN